MEKKELLEALGEQIMSKLDEETLARLKNAKSKEEVMQILGSTTFELTPEQMSQGAGGYIWPEYPGQTFGDERDDLDGALIAEDLKRGVLNGSMFF